MNASINYKVSVNDLISEDVDVLESYVEVLIEALDDEGDVQEVLSETTLLGNEEIFDRYDDTSVDNFGIIEVFFDTQVEAEDYAQDLVYKFMLDTIKQDPIRETL